MNLCMELTNDNIQVKVRGNKIATLSINDNEFTCEFTMNQLIDICSKMIIYIQGKGHLSDLFYESELLEYTEDDIRECEKSLVEGGK